MRTARKHDREDGMGIIEVVVAMFLLAIVAVALLPVFTSTMTLARQDITFGRAAEIANQQVGVGNQLSAQNPNVTCADIGTLAHGRQAVSGAGNSDFTDSVVVSGCPTTYPGTLNVTITVWQGTAGKKLAVVNTLITAMAAN